MQGEALIATWERGSLLSQPLRALALLAEGGGRDEQQAAALGVPERDAALLAVRQRSFGSTLQGFAICRSCSERLEFTLSAGDIGQRLGNAGQCAASIRQGPWSLQCRFANTGDLEAAASQPELTAARQVLLARCVTAAHEDGRRAQLTDLPPELLAVAEQRLAEMHAAAELTLSLTCAACEARQDVVLDLAEFLWAETRHAARRLLAEVHELAWAYGWSESAILAMSQPRRAAYLALVRS